MKTRNLINILILQAFSLLSFATQADVMLTFGMYTSDAPQVLTKKFKPVLQAIERRMTEVLGEPVTIKTVIAKSYDEGVDNLVSGKADFSRFGPASYVQAKKREAGIHLLAMEAIHGKKEFYGVIAVPWNSSIHKVSDIKGKRFAFGSEDSTIGRYLSQQYLLKHNIRAADLSAYAYLGRHDKVGLAVADGTFDAGALKENTFEKLLSKGKRLRAIAHFKNATKPWIARANLPERELEALRETLLILNDPLAFKALKKNSFVAADDKDFDEIRQAIENNAKFFE